MTEHEDNAPRLYIADDTQLVALIQKAYELSRPQGMGFMHYVEGDSLTDDDAQEVIDANAGHPISLDYVRGRAVKLRIAYDPTRTQYFLRDEGRWFDHAALQWAELKAVLA